MTAFRKPMLGILAACSALALFVSTVFALSVGGQDPAPAGQTVPNLPASVELRKTVGIDSDTCATATTLVVPPETAVYYCYQVKNTSNFTLPRHQLDDDDVPGAILPDNNGEGFRYDFMPGETINTVEMGFVATRVVTQETPINLAIWESYVNDDLYAQDSAYVTVLVRNPAISAVLRVGAGDGCSGNSALAGNAGDAYALCLALTNSGEITLTNHALSIPALGINAVVSAPIAPGAVLLITRAHSAQLGTRYVTGTLALSASITSTYTLQGVPFSAQAASAGSVNLLNEADARTWLPRVQRNQ